jgi:hypothetical protein
VRGLLLVVALAGAHPALGQQAGVTQQADGGPMTALSRQDHVISGQEIRDWGLIRVSDILELAPGFSGWSRDGFRTDGFVFNAGPAGSQQWRIAIDGQEVDARFVDGFHSETLPVSTSSIKSVRLRPPGSGPGGLSSSGWILFETIALDSLAATASVAVGNEVGDPGPYRYTDLATPNVDRDGPSADIQVNIPITAGLGKGAFFKPKNGGPLRFSLGVRADQAHLTNEAILDRVYVLFDGARKPRMTLIQPRFGIELQRRGGVHRVTWTQTTLRDLPFLEAMGSELPVSRHSRSIRASGMQRTGGISLSYSISASRSSLPERSNGQDLALGWADSLLRLRLEIGSAAVNPDWSLGYSILKRRPDSRGFEPSLPPVPRFDFKIARSMASGWSQVWSGQIVLGRYPSTRVLPGLSVDMVRTEGLWTWSARAGFVAETPEETGVEALWLAGGWDYPGDGAARSAAQDQAQDIRTGSLDLQIQREKGGSSWAVALYGRAVHGVNLPVYRLEPDSLFEARYLSGRVFEADVGGIILGVRAWATQKLGDHLNHRLDYGFAHKPEGDEAFEQAMSGLPQVRLRYSLRAQPYPRTFLGVIARFDSETEWLGYRTESGGTGVIRLPARVAVDATFSKQLAGTHLRVYATLKNLTRGLTSGHPTGPLQDMVFVAGLRVSL